jgi:hypothetical protein
MPVATKGAKPRPLQVASAEEDVEAPTSEADVQPAMPALHLLMLLPSTAPLL